MNVFEFLLVIVSILLGLGITELLAGFVRILRGELVAAVIFPSAGSAESLDTHLMRRRRLRVAGTEFAPPKSTC